MMSEIFKYYYYNEYKIFKQKWLEYNTRNVLTRIFKLK